MKRLFCIVIAGVFLLAGCGKYKREATIYGDWAVDDYGFSWKVTGFSDGDRVELTLVDTCTGNPEMDNVDSVQIIPGVAEDYEIVARVVEISYGEVIAEDFSGSLWGFFGDGYEVGEYLTLIMSDNGTPGILDDIVKGVKHE